MNKLYLSGSIVPALIVAGLACLVISYAAAGAPTKAGIQNHAATGKGQVKSIGDRHDLHGQPRGLNRLDLRVLNRS